MKTKVFIADDHPVIRNGIRSILSKGQEYEVVGEANNGTDALAGIAKSTPDVVVMDITMPGVDGITATKRITEEFPEMRVIMLSMHTDVHSAIDAFRAGALGYVLKDSPPEELLTAVARVSEGGKYASPAIAEDLLDGFVDKIKKEQTDDPFGSLSLREKEVLRMIADGATSKDIAEKLFISVSTVKSHRNKLMKKLNVHDMAALIKIAIRKGIVGSD